MRIAIDAMGGDHAPDAVVSGAVLAVERSYATPGQIVLVGDVQRIREVLSRHGRSSVEVPSNADLPPPDESDFVVVPASQTVGMHESPTSALRQKRDSSLLVATRLVKEGKAQALCSAGNTGACVAAAMLNLRSLEGVHRPGIAVTIDGDNGPITIIDVGANVVPKAKHLFQYGIMGTCLARTQHHKEDPRVGLINIGGEEGKGNQLAKETQELFRDTSLNFIGNIEGQQVFQGAVDVLVTEGFLGNVILKLSEGLAAHILHVAQEELVKAGVAPAVLKAALAGVMQRTDYSEYGGALLLGVEGIVTICHGRSEDRAIANAIRVSVEAMKSEINQTIVEAIRELGG